MAHYHKEEIDISLYDYFYFNNLYLVNQECYRISIYNSTHFTLIDHIRKQQKWNKTIESAALYVMREFDAMRLTKGDEVILIRAQVEGLDLRRLAKFLHQKEVLSQEEWELIDQESIVVALDTPKYIEHTLHHAEELLEFLPSV